MPLVLLPTPGYILRALNELDSRMIEARRIAAKAGRLALQYFEAPERHKATLKGHQDWVTEADKAVEVLVRSELQNSFPGEGFLGEETGQTGGDSSVWVCDPIDGTQNFMRGMPVFAVTLSFVVDGKTLVGITEEPVHDRSYACRLGGGAFVNDSRIRVRPDATLQQAVLGIGYNCQRSRSEFFAALEAFFELGAEFRRIGSAAICLTHVATGRLDAFWQMHLKSWDVISGLLLVQEAGGLACDFLAQDGLTSGNPVLAGAPGVIEALSETLKIPLIPPA